MLTFSPGMLWGYIRSMDMLGYEETKLPTSSQEIVLFKSLLNLSCPWGVSRQNVRRKIKCWLDNQYLARWRGLGSTQRQAQELISGTSPGAKTRLLSFNRTQSRIVIGLLTGHNTLRRYYHVMGLSNNPICRRGGDEMSAHILFECDALASLRHVYLGSFFLDPEDIKGLSLGAIWSFSKGTGLP